MILLVTFDIVSVESDRLYYLLECVIIVRLPQLPVLEFPDL